MDVDHNNTTPPPSPFWVPATSPTLLDTPSPSATPAPALGPMPTTSTIAVPNTNDIDFLPPSSDSSPALPWNHGLTIESAMPDLATRIIYASLGDEIMILHAGVLGLASDVLANMFQACRQDGEGSIPENPWVLEGCATTGQWRSFLRFAYPAHYSILDSCFVTQDWLDLLAFSHKFDVPGAFKRAREALGSRSLSLCEEGDMSPFHRLHLGRRYDIDEWIGQAVPLIAQISPYEVSVEDMQLIGYASTRLLFRLHLRLKDHRQQLATNLPSLLSGSGHHAHCENNGQCSENWQIACNQLMSGLFRQEDPLTEYAILDLLQQPDYQTASMTKMNRLCVQKISRIASRSLVGRDQEFVREVVDKIRLD